MKYQEHTISNQANQSHKWLDFIKLRKSTHLSNASNYERIQISIKDNAHFPSCVIFFQNSIPRKVTYGVNGRTKKEEQKTLSKYSFSKEISQEEFENNSYLASKIMTLGVEVLSEPEFNTSNPKPSHIESENKDLIEECHINNQQLNNQYIQDSSFIEIGTSEEFNRLLKEDKAVLYNRIDWSGVDRIGRIKIAKSLRKFSSDSLPRYIINNSNQEYEFYNNFIKKKNVEFGRLSTYGSGEIFLFKKGKVIDYISRGFLVNSSELDTIFKKWKTGNTG